MVRLLVIGLLIFLSACSQKKESEVRLEISNNFIFGGTETQAIAGGGLMVWGKSAKGASFARAIVDTDAISLQLINDNWVFFAMAWDGSHDYKTNNPGSNVIFGGKIKCARSNPVTLEGGNAGVGLFLTNAQCGLPAFKGLSSSATTVGSAPNLELPKIRFRFCDSLQNVQGPADLCTDKLSDANRKARKAPVTSYRVILNNHFSMGPLHNIDKGGLIGPCIPFNGLSEESLNLTGTSNINFPSVPAGGADLPFHTTIETFISDEACDQAISRGAIPIHMPNGIGASSPGHKYFANGSMHVAAINITPGMVCKERGSTTLGVHPFAAGKGSETHPFVICSPQQLFRINDSTENLVKFYKLQNSLDLNPFSKDTGPEPLPDLHKCLSPRSNFLPFGYVGNTCDIATGAMNWGAITAFKGKFFGAGFTLINLRHYGPETSNVGLFAKFAGHATVVQELELHNPNMIGKCLVGALAGESDSLTAGYTSVMLHDIKVIGGRIQAMNQDPGSTCSTNSYVGSVTGTMINGSLIRSMVLGTIVEGFMGHIGGAIGYANTTIFERVAVEADVKGLSPGSVYVGGVVGKIEASKMDWVKHEGLVLGNATKVGGIAGEMNNPVNFNNFYAISSVINFNTIKFSYTGGVVGNWANGTLVTPLGPGYSLSMVRTGCLSGGAGCAAGPFTGGTSIGEPTPATPGSLYKLQSDLQHLTNAINAVASLNNESTSSQDDFQQTGTPTPLSSLTNGGLDDWIHVPGSYPRFDFENHPCSQVGISGSGDGSDLSPKLICNANQYLALGSASPGTYHKLMSNIRLPNELADSPTASEIATFSATLRGHNKALIGGHKSFNGSTITGHIGTVAPSATIRNLKVYGMSRSRTLPAISPENYAGLFVGHNQGTLIDIKVYGFMDFKDLGAGVVGKNSNQMQQVEFNGLVWGTSNLAGLAVNNEGNITDSIMNGELRCNFPSCARLSGLVYINSGNVLKTEMSGRINDPAGKVSSNTSMLADTNDGTISDILISQEANFRVLGSNHYYFSRINNGTISRSINLGKLIVSSPAFGVAMTGWPTTNGAGVYNDVLRAGRSGVLLLENAPYTCATTATLDIPAWNAAAYAGGWNTGPFFMWAYNGQANSSKKLIVEITRDDGSKLTAQVLEEDSLNGRFSVTIGLCATPGKVDLYWTDDIPVLPGTTSPKDQTVLLSQYAHNKAAYLGTWQDPDILWELSNAADSDASMAYSSYLLGFAAPQQHAIWELENGKLTLFNSKL